MLDRKKKYLQIALNSSSEEGERIIANLPKTERIVIEAGTPLIKAYGADGIRRLKNAWAFHTGNADAYVVADMKCADRAKTEVHIAKGAGANAVTVLGSAPIATIRYVIDACNEAGIDSMIDMIGVEHPVKILRAIKTLPTVVILHRGVDEELFDKNTPIPYLQINKIRSSFDVMIAIAGGDTIREVQRAIFNDANIVVVWKNFYSHSSKTGVLAEQFLKEIK